MGWGSQTRGTTEWGGDGATAGGGGPIIPPGIGGSGSITISGVELLSHDSVLVTFSEPVSGGNVFDTSNWTLSSNLNLEEVIASGPENDPVHSVILLVNNIQEATKYVISTNNLVGASGSALDPSSTASFVGRETKLDKVLTGMPSLYDTSPKSLSRAVFLAMFREDDKIGGDQEEG